MSVKMIVTGVTVSVTVSMTMTVIVTFMRNVPVDCQSVMGKLFNLPTNPH